MKKQWRKGSPPEIGWWPASAAKDPTVIRWWNGKEWSVPVYPAYTSAEAAKWAKVKTMNTNFIFWTDRWWL